MSIFTSTRRMTPSELQCLDMGRKEGAESERKRLQVKTAATLITTNLTTDELTRVMDIIYPEDIVIKPIKEAV